MKITIHRGANEIGGTCIQLSTEQTTILLDLGLPLSKDSKELDVAALAPDAVLISHPHQDHFGLIEALDHNVPVYMGELSRNLINATRMLLGIGLLKNEIHYFQAWQPSAIGDFVITPYLVDHSAVDAYAFLIEAEGKRIFYSGDFRAHGRKSVLFDRITNNPPKDIDLLFMEGTMIQRCNDDFPTEADVEKKIYETIKEQENITFLISSSQNIDRIVSAFRACKRARKTLVLDIYTAWVLEQLKLISKNIPAMEWDQIKVKLSYSQHEKLKDNPDFFGDFRKRVYQQRISREEMQANPAEYLFFSKMSHYKTINLHKKIKPANVIYSQWLGYLSGTDEDYYGAEAIAGYQNDPQVNFVYAHTSGHATVEDLQTFAAALNPKMLVPVHTEYGGYFSSLFNNVTIVSDGREFDLSGGRRDMAIEEFVNTVESRRKPEEIKEAHSESLKIKRTYRRTYAHKETEEAINSALDDKENHAKVYKKKCVNWSGNVSDAAREPYTEVIARVLLNATLNIQTVIRKHSYLVHNTKVKYSANKSIRKEEREAIRLFNDGLEGKTLPFGRIVEYQIPIKGKMAHEAGKIDLAAHATDNKTLIIIELKVSINKETLLRSLLEIETYYRQIDVSKLKDEFEKKGYSVKNIKKALLLYEGCSAYREYREMLDNKRPEIKKLLDKYAIEILIGPVVQTIERAISQIELTGQETGS
jgi:ribonuclease J